MQGVQAAPEGEVLAMSQHCEQPAREVIAASEREEWLSVREVARRLSVNPKQVRKWIQAGQFDEIAVFSARLTRISSAAYRRFVKKSQAA